MALREGVLLPQVSDGGDAPVEAAVGAVLRDLRSLRGLTAKDLAEASGVSAAMVSRIESGQVSASLATLAALARALEVPLAGLFREAGRARADFTLVRQGQGLAARRIAGAHAHDFVSLGFHNRPGLRFDPVLVTLTRREGVRPPEYQGHGCLFLYMLEGEAIYAHDGQAFRIGAGDSLSFDAELPHGFVEVLSERVRFLSVQAERI
jgi:transcriptional regulator with XRE-family HTH domain